MKNNHHNIPLSLNGADSHNNIIRIDEQAHQRLHQEQNISSRELRNFRKKVNGILVPNDYTESMYEDLLLQYFGNAQTEVLMQKMSIAKQIASNIQVIGGREVIGTSHGMSELVEKYIDSRKDIIKKLTR